MKRIFIILALLLAGPAMAQNYIANVGVVDPTSGIGLKVNADGSINITGAVVPGTNLSSGTVTPALPGAGSRTLSSMAADVVNVKSFGAAGNNVQITAAFTIGSGSPNLSAGSSVFTSSMVGESVVLAGAGSAGAALITTISSYTSPTAVVLATNASTAVSAVTSNLWVGTDDTAAINAAIGVAKNVLFASRLGTELYFPGGIYLTLGGINLTGIQSNYMQIRGDGAWIYSANTGNAAVDALGSSWFKYTGLSIYGNQYATPTTGLQIGRTNTTAINSSDNHIFENFVIGGYETLAGLYDMNAEESEFNTVQVFNTYSSANAFSAIFDGINHWGLTSQFQTLSQPANTQQSFLGTVAINCIFYGAGSAPLWVGGTNEMRFISGYAVNTSTLGTYYGMEIYNLAGVTSNNDLDVDIHFETNVITNSFLFTGTNATPTITGFRYREPYEYATVSTFALDSGVTSLNLRDAHIDIYQDAAGETPALFDNAANYTVSGQVYLPSGANWTAPASFAGYLNLSGTVSYAAPTATFPALSSSTVNAPGGSVSAVTKTNSGQFFYTSATAVPTLAFSAPPSGTTATSAVTSMKFSGINTFGSNGTGYAVNDILTVPGGTCSTQPQIKVLTLGASNAISTFSVQTVGSCSVIPSGTVAMTGGTGSGATISVGTWSINTFSFTGGSGYITTPTITTTAPSGSSIGTQPTWAITVSTSLTLGGSAGSVILNSGGTLLGPGSLATNATAGFQYFSSGAGTPTGVPTSESGYAPIYIDTTNDALWMYDGSAWKSYKTVLTGTTGSIGGGALLAGNCATGTATISGITSAMAISTTPVTYPGAGFDWQRTYMSGTNTVTVQVCADVAGTPGATAYNVRAVQ